MMKDSYKNMAGVFTLQIIEVATGRILEAYEDKNLIVASGQTNVAKLLGGDAAGTKVSKIAMGTGTATPALSDTGLTNTFSKAIDGVTYPTSNSVLFNWSIDATDSNGVTLTEFGLLNDNNVLIARKVREPIVKTSAVRLVGTWTLSFN